MSNYDVSTFISTYDNEESYIILEPTHFGYAVNINIPTELSGSIEEILAGCSSPVIITNKVLETSCHFIGYQNIIYFEERYLK